MRPVDPGVKVGKFHVVINKFDNDMKHLPPLRAVTAFEACYRLESFTKAAKSLNVGQPAVSHQIRSLELDLGTKLFVKHGAKIRPTAPADDLYLSVSSGLSEIARASERIRRRSRDDGLAVATYPGIAAFWLLPRIAAGPDAGAGPHVRVTTADRDSDLPLDESDCAILFGTGAWAGFDAELLRREHATPVASPALAEIWKDRPPEELLARAPLIHLEDPEHRWFTWDDWRQRKAPDASHINKAVTVTNHGIAIQEALLGAGIALGWAGVIDDLVARGALVRLSQDAIRSERGYYLVRPPGEAAAARSDWLLDLLTES